MERTDDGRADAKDVGAFLDAFRGILPDKGSLSFEVREEAMEEMRKKGAGIFPGIRAGVAGFFWPIIWYIWS
ncbi:MAG: hypothetical protein JW724_07420 [Candidatus Altiarchaeota archaeon]|nr:hypothetical protein [Candidatus Altiarchaeota archaeon]